MPDDSYTKWTITDESFPVMAFERSKNPFQRRWTCPSDDAIAAYVDGGLRDEKKTQLETHLAKCERCRSMVADVIKLRRDDELPVPPVAAAKKVLAIPPRVRTRSGLMWAPAGAVAIVVFVAAIVTLHREPQKPALSSPPVPSAPMVAKVEPAEPAKSGIADITRQPLIPNTVPIILSPLQDSTVKRDRVEFTWKPVGRSRYYQISVVTSDGDLLWAGRTEASSLCLPGGVMLKHGSYFVWVTAYLIDGQVTKSSPIRFVVDR